MPTTEVFAQWAHLILEWIGFGTLVGLLAKAIMPGRDPGGAVATLLMGIAGSIIGAGTFSFFVPDQRITPLSPVGFLVAVAGAFALLAFYRLMAGYYIREVGTPNVPRAAVPTKSRRRSGARVTVVED